MQMNTGASGAMTWPVKQAGGGNPLIAGTPAPAPATKGASAAGLTGSVGKEEPPAAKADSADGTEDRFLQLLVAQMRNQDPLNPMDNAQVTSQLAQISTVRGIEGLNRTMSEFVAANGQSSAMSSVAMLGKQVLVPGDTFKYQPPGAGATTRIGFELNGAATAARVQIVDAAGEVVHTRNLSSLRAGMQTFEWDGRKGGGGAVAAGPLTVRIAAVDGTTAVAATTLVPARVVGIGQSAGAVQLELDGPAPVAPSEVRIIL